MKGFWLWQIKEAEAYKREYKENGFVNADISFSDSLHFQWGSYTLKLFHAAANGHSEGDVMVWIPEIKLLVTGDIVVAPTPYATYLNIPGMIGSLQNVIDIGASIIIPGHGEVMHDLKYVQLLKRALTAYMVEAEKAIADNVPAREALNKIILPDIDNEFTGNNDLKKWAYRSFFARYLVYNIYKLRGKI
jgi:cyclase